MKLFYHFTQDNGHGRFWRLNKTETPGWLDLAHRPSPRVQIMNADSETHQLRGELNIGRAAGELDPVLGRENKKSQRQGQLYLRASIDPSSKHMNAVNAHIYM